MQAPHNILREPAENNNYRWSEGTERKNHFDSGEGGISQEKVGVKFQLTLKGKVMQQHLLTPRWQ